MTAPSASGVLHVTPGDDLPLHAARAAVTEAIAAACNAGVRKLLVDFHGWRGQESPSLSLRIDSVFEWSAAAASAPGLVTALVMPPGLVDPGKIGFIIGRRIGFNFDVFGSVDEALAWLESERVAVPPPVDGRD